MTPWTEAHQAPLSMGFSRQEYWSGLPFPPPGNRLNPGIEPRSPALIGEIRYHRATREALLSYVLPSFALEHSPAAAGDYMEGEII